MVTIKDIAREVGLSVTTVSRALSDHDDVAEHTKARIREVADRLDYHPNAVARSLQNRRSNAIGLVIPPIFHRAYDAFWLEFIGGMATVCAQRGVDLLLSAIDAPRELDLSLQRLVRSRRIDGVLICDVRRTDPRIAYLQKHDLPFVAFGRTIGEKNYSFIDVDGAAGVLQAISHVQTLGHRRIAFLDVDTSFSFAYFRLEGYREALARADVPFDPELVHEGLTEHSAVLAARRLFAMRNRPTAIFAAADYLALAVLKTAREAGLEIPRDLSLAVFDDNLVVQQADPPLTAIGQPNRRLGEEAADLLLARIARPDQPLAQRLVVPALTIRHSTAPPPNATRPVAAVG
jgi:DNA-binding LacI/PurR family transcriptional regulator